MDKLSELLDKRKVIDKQIDEIYEQKRKEREQELHRFNVGIMPHVEGILPFLKHDRTSCSDDSPNNYGENNGVPRCRKCALIETVRVYHDLSPDATDWIIESIDFRFEYRWNN